MENTQTAPRPQCDRIAHYVAADGRRCSIPVPAGRTPDGFLSRYGITYVLALVAQPTGEDADAIVDRAILRAVREADAAGEIDALLAEDVA